MPNHIAIRCALKMANNNDIDAEEIDQVVITVPLGHLQNSYYTKPFELREFPHGDAIFSYPYTVATTLLHKGIGLPNFTEDAIHDPKVNAITAKTKLVEPTDGTTGMVISLYIRMKNGEEYFETDQVNRDWAFKGTPTSEIIEKFWHQVDFSQTISRSNAERLIELIGRLDELDSVHPIIELMTVKN